MGESKKQLQALEDRLVGRYVSVYETGPTYRPIRREDAFICRGQILGLGEPLTSAAVDLHDETVVATPRTKTQYGRFLRLHVIAAAQRHKSKIGNEYTFNVADEDINAILGGAGEEHAAAKATV